MMTPRFFIILILGFIIAAASNTHLIAGKRRTVAPPPDTRNLVTAVNQQTKTITVTSMMNKTTQTYQFADATFYKPEVIINGQEKSINDITVGLQLITCEEIQAGVIQSITLGTAAPTPGKKEK